MPRPPRLSDAAGQPRAYSSLIDTLSPLSLYVHIPWCVRKCPYCDFNSHALRGEIPEHEFVTALLLDFEQELLHAGEQRPLSSIFIGGGTPSLLSGAGIHQLISGIKTRSTFTDDIEITLEANPGTAEAGRFSDYRAAGVNRLSIGVQSFDPASLSALGRIHGGQEAVAAVRMARDAGLDNVNLDLMFGLPGQTLEQARRDMQTAIALDPQHISYYQLTLEPNTLFHSQPPPLPNDELIWDIQEQGQALLAGSGYEQYEVSAYARAGRRCRHNLNYWQFGDYLGIGPGAHGKITNRQGSVLRRWKRRKPSDYMQGRDQGGFLSGSRQLETEDLCLEFLMNALRLTQGFALSLFEERTGMPASTLESSLNKPLSSGLIDMPPGRITPTPKGYAFLNELLTML